MTPRRIASQQRTQVPHSAPGDSRKDALWGCYSHEKAHSGRATSRKSAFCVWASPKGAFCMRAVVAPRGHFRRSVYTPASPRLPAAAQQCTQMPQNGAERPFSPICVHSCVTTPARSVATVYTNAPKRRREVIFADLCTLLHTHGRSQRRNSVHKCPETAPRAHLRRSVYTPASPRLPAAAQQCTQMPRNGSESPFSPICVHSCIPTPAHNVATVYTNAPKRLRESVFADLCTLLHTHGRSQRQAEELDEFRLRPVCLFASPYSDPIKRKAF